jgi:hypothetical protein
MTARPERSRPAYRKTGVPGAPAFGALGWRTGEHRKVRRALRIECLPVAMLDRVRASHAAGRHWVEIEDESPGWPECKIGVGLISPIFRTEAGKDMFTDSGRGWQMQAVSHQR